jgi:hypothetical protein
MMRSKATRVFAITPALFLLCVLSAGALEIGGVFQMGNLGFQAGRLSTDTSFAGTDFLYAGSLYMRANILENFQVQAGYRRDLILRNVVYSLLRYRVDYFSLGIGMFVGFFNSGGSTLNSGVTTSISLELPGVAFVSLSSDNSLAGGLSETGDFSQRLIDLAVGFYVKNAICSLNLSSKEYAEMQGSSEITDRLIRYSVKADIFQKNVPFRLVLALAYQTLDKKFLDGATSLDHGLNSVLLGAELDLSLGPRLELTLGIEDNLFTLGSGVLAGNTYLGLEPYLFQAYTGFRLSLERPAREDSQDL